MFYKKIEITDKKKIFYTKNYIQIQNISCKKMFNLLDEIKILLNIMLK